MTPKIAIVGMNHQGYILAAGFAKLGYHVNAVGSPSQFPANEPGLVDLLSTHQADGRLVFLTSVEGAVFNADYVYLASDITFGKEGVNLPPVFQLAAEIEKYRDPASILCVATQVPVGTTEKLTTGRVAYVPELLRPGQSLHTFFKADRIIIGSEDSNVIGQVARLYYPLLRPIIRMNLRSAEMSKHAHNAILATQISFIEEMGRICDLVGADIHSVAEAVKADHRVGKDSYLNPGWTLKGGHAVRDVRVLRRLGVPTPLMDAVIANEEGL